MGVDEDGNAAGSISGGQIQSAGALLQQVQTVTWTGREPVEYSVTFVPRTIGNRYRVISAQMPDATTLLMQVQLNQRLPENLTLTKYGTDRIRTMSTQTYQGFLVRDGVVVATGRPTPWLQKCP